MFRPKPHFQFVYLNPLKDIPAFFSQKNELAKYDFFFFLRRDFVRHKGQQSQRCDILSLHLSHLEAFISLLKVIPSPFFF